ncbi:hypothetical protein [Cronobacter muytjensii]|uniref:hypothetical protein n=1 Tax=Cronobacter muytjensii TaxID=413501 RepID=UPI00158808D5|nr:hypothetical protein [Cronobacter muytjensii]NUW61557.1 hypothetical protein [Cronobacter muytjensii]
MNNDELIAAGHELAKCLDNEPLLDIAKMIVRLADKLDVTTLALREKTKQCEQLAAENAALKSAIQTHSESVHFCEVCGKDDPCSTDDVCYVLKETPATDAFIAEQWAQGVEMLAAYCQKRRNEMMKTEPNEPAINQAIAAIRRAGEFAAWFAAGLRQGGAA